MGEGTLTEAIAHFSRPAPRTFIIGLYHAFSHSIILNIRRQVYFRFGGSYH